MFGWTILRTSEFRLIREMADMELTNAIAAQHRAEEYARKAEALLDHERSRIDSERERADRIADSLFQSQGLPPTSTTVVTEVRAQEKIHADKLAEYAHEIASIYEETETDMIEDGAEPLPEILEEKKP